MDTVGRVNSLIQARGMSLFQLSRRSGIPYSTLANSKRRSGQLSVETIERICGALGITLSEFFAETEKGIEGCNSDYVVTRIMCSIRDLG